jgi:hypothetical protein
MTTLPTPAEYWRPIHGFEGAYEISTNGHVRSLDRIVKMQGGFRTAPGKTRSLTVNGNGCDTVTLNKDGKREKHIVSRLMGLNFIPGVGSVVRHLNGNNRDNVINNLAWGSFKENTNDMRGHGTMAIGAKNGKAKLTAAQVASVLLSSEIDTVIAARLNVSEGAIQHIKSGKTWKHVCPEIPRRRVWP